MNNVGRAGAYIVTGGAGFIGSNLVAELLRRDPAAHVIVIDPLRSGSYANIVEACERRGVGAFRGELHAVDAAEVAWSEITAERAVDAIFHLGAITDTTVMDEREMLLCNTHGFSAMLRSARELDTPLVYASSAAVYGTPPQAARREPFTLDAAGRPNNVYGFSKWMMECEHARQMRDEPSAHVVGLRYFNVYGPGESRKGRMASMAYQLAIQCLRGERPRLFKHGEQARDQVHVDDVVECTLAAGGLGARGRNITPGVYNLGSGAATTFNDVVSSVRAGLGLSAGECEVEYFEMPQTVRQFYQDFTLADMCATEMGLGWRPTRSPKESIREYAAWLARRANYDGSGS